MTTATWRVRRAGDRAFLIETGDLATAHRLDKALRTSGREGLVEIVPGACTVLVVVDPDRVDPLAVGEALAHTPLAELTGAPPAPVEVPVVYDGADLEEVCRMTGLTEHEVVERHTGGDHVVAFLGFSPGFGYIAGLDPSLRVPRRDSPRTAVPAGSVAIATEYTAVYPTTTPGGWRIIGRTDLRVWDVQRDPPALLRPGTPVRFVRVGP